jgi:hypothetical protein
MSTKTVCNCDHCGTEIPFTSNKVFAMMGTDAAYSVGHVHGCSKEHLGFAVAKTFGIPIDGDLAGKVDELKAHSNRVGRMLETSQKELVAAQSHKMTAQSSLDTAKDRIQRMEQDLGEKAAQIATLQEQLAHTPPPPNVNGKTPADVAREAFQHVVQNHHESEGVSGWDAAARAVLSAFAPDPAQAVREALGRVRERIEKGWLVLNAIDAELSTLPAADLTDPQKPTKPIVVECGECLGRGRVIDLYQKTDEHCERCNGSGKVTQ